MNMTLDAMTIKAMARGREVDILADVAGIPLEKLDGGEHSCEKCGGNTRARLIDRETGAYRCSHCFPDKCGDFLAVIMWMTEKTLPEAIRMTADYLGVKPSSNGQHKANGAAVKKDPFAAVTWAEGDLLRRAPGLIGLWCAKKLPISPEAVEAFGGRVCNWPAKDGSLCLGFVGTDLRGTKKALLLYRITGMLFPPFGKLSERKTHLVGGSVESWLMPKGESIEAAEVAHKCEGLPDAMTLYSAGLPAGHVAITNACGAGSVKKLDYSWATDKGVVVAADADEPGIEGGKLHAIQAHKAGAKWVKLITPPGYEINETHGRDFRDWFADGHSMSEYLELIDATEPVTDEQVEAWDKAPKANQDTDEDGTPVVIVSPDEPLVVDQAIELLATAPNVYQRAGSLVQIVRDAKPPRGIARPQSAPRIATLKQARLQELLSSVANWLKPKSDSDGFERCHPPAWAVKAVEARGEWGTVRRLEGVAEVPILRADGTVLQTPGYDEKTGIVFEPQQSFPNIPNKPTRAESLQAAADLLEVVEDFPFGDGAHRAAWVAATLTPLTRFAYDGPAPMFLVDANVRGCGKSLLTDCIALITSGRDMARMTAPRDEDEFRKRITAMALSGELLILIDNVSTALGGPAIDAALTATTWSDRVLGESRMATGIPLVATWFATGNNIILAGDMVRRVAHVRLQSPEETPEQRTGFKHPDLLAWVRAERPRLTAAALTVLAGYCAAGRPGMKLRPWGSFQAWSDLVRNAVVWCGLPDPGETRTQLACQADRDGVALRLLVDGWQELDPAGVGVTASAALKTLADHPNDYETLRNAIGELVYTRDGKLPSPRSLGMKLHHVHLRVIGGRYLDKRDTRMGAQWFATVVEECGTSGSSGTNSDPLHTRQEQLQEQEIYKPGAVDSSAASGASPAPLAKSPDGMSPDDTEAYDDFMGN